MSLSTGLQSSLFYNVKKKQNLDLPDVSTNINGGIFKVFHRQLLAFQYFDSLELDIITQKCIRLFSFESKTNGKRKFLVASWDEFLKKYFEDDDPDSRSKSHHGHFYEIIRDGFPCRLYFDVEYSKLDNPAADGNRMTREWIQLVVWKVYELYGIIMNQQHVIVLDSSTEEKFSKHIIIHLIVDCSSTKNHDTSLSNESNMYTNTSLHSCKVSPTGLICNVKDSYHAQISTNSNVEYYFKNNMIIHDFIECILTDITMPSSINPAERIPKPSYQYLWVHHKDSDKLSFFVDLGVYTRNRMFRIFGCAKYGKNRTLRLHPHDRQHYNPMEIQSCDEKKNTSNTNMSVNTRKMMFDYKLKMSLVIPNHVYTFINPVIWHRVESRIYQKTDDGENIGMIDYHMTNMFDMSRVLDMTQTVTRKYRLSLYAPIPSNLSSYMTGNNHSQCNSSQTSVTNNNNNNQQESIDDSSVMYNDFISTQLPKTLCNIIHRYQKSILNTHVDQNYNNEKLTQCQTQQTQESQEELLSQPSMSYSFTPLLNSSSYNSQTTVSSSFSSSAGTTIIKDADIRGGSYSRPTPIHNMPIIRLKKDAHLSYTNTACTSSSSSFTMACIGSGVSNSSGSGSTYHENIRQWESRIIAKSSLYYHEYNPTSFPRNPCSIGGTYPNHIGNTVWQPLDDFITKNCINYGGSQGRIASWILYVKPHQHQHQHNKSLSNSTTTTCISNTVSMSTPLSSSSSLSPYIDSYSGCNKENIPHTMNTMNVLTPATTVPNTCTPIASKVKNKYTLRYNITNNKYCHNIGRQHKSNGIMLEIDFNFYMATQVCWDPDCRGYRSPPWIIPVDCRPPEGYLEEYHMDQELLKYCESNNI